MSLQTTDLWILLVINLIVSIAGAVSISGIRPGDVPAFLITMGVAIAYLVLFAPGSLFCWFLPAYYGYK